MFPATQSKLLQGCTYIHGILETNFAFRVAIFTLHESGNGTIATDREPQ